MPDVHSNFHANWHEATIVPTGKKVLAGSILYSVIQKENALDFSVKIDMVKTPSKSGGEKQSFTGD